MSFDVAHGGFFLAQTIPELHLMLFSVLFSLFVLLCMDARPRPKKLRTDVQAAVQVLQSITSTCSHNALTEILSGLRDGGVDLDTVAPSMVRRAALARGRSMSIQIDMPLADSDDTFGWVLLDPCQLLTVSVAASPRLQSLLARARREHPCRMDHHWRMVIAFDEYSPGNNFNCDNGRKPMVLSYSFMELGTELHSELVWFTPVVLRSKMIHTIDGGWSACLRNYVIRHCYSTSGISTAGIPLTIQGQSVLLFASVSNFLSDADGFRVALDWKGCGSLKPCVKHFSILKKGSGLVGRGGEAEFVEISDCSFDAHKPWATEDACDCMEMLLVSRRRVAEGTMTTTAYKELEKTVGLNSNGRGLLADRELSMKLNLINSVTYDWVHNTFQDGVFVVEATELLTRLQDHGVGFAEIEAWLKDDGWVFRGFGKLKAKHLHRIFSQWRIPKSSSESKTKLRGSASEMYGLYGLLRHFFETRHFDDPATLLAERNSFNALCSFVDLISRVKNGIADARATAPTLRRALAEHNRVHKLAYGESLIKPKHHLNADIPGQWTRDGVSIDAFVIERAHLRVKRIAENCKTTQTYELTVLAGLVNYCIQQLTKAAVSGDMLLGRTQPLPGLPDVTVAFRMEVAGQEMHCGDVLIREGVAGLVVACLQEGDALYLLVNVWRWSRDVSPHSAEWIETDVEDVWLAFNVHCCLAWYSCGERTWVVLRE